MIRRLLPVMVGLLLTGASAAGSSPELPREEPLDLDLRERVAVTAEALTLEGLAERDRPAFVTVIHLKELPLGRTSLPEVLAGQVGLNLRRTGGPESPATVSIRGSGADQVLILLDGVPLGSAADQSVDLSTIPLGALDRIEVLRGSESAVFGSGAMGGVVNLITARADRESRLGLELGYGSWDTLRAGLDWTGRLAGADLRLHLNHQRGDGDFEFLNDGGTEHDPEDDFVDRRAGNRHRSTGLLLTARSEPIRDWTADLTLEGYQRHRGVPGLITFPSPHAREEERHWTSTFRLRGEAIAARPIRANLRLFHRWGELEFDDPQGEQTGVPAHSLQDDRSWGLAGTLAWEPRPWHLSATLQAEQERLRDEDLGRLARTVWAAAGRAEGAVWAERLQGTALVRYDRVEDTRSRWSAKGGLRLDLGRGWGIRTNLGSGFRTPSFAELYRTEGFLVGNPDLRPETSRSYDAGVSYRSRRLRAEAAWFRTDHRDLIQYILVSGFRFTPLNIGRSRSTGLELDLAWTPRPWLTCTGSYTYLEAVDRTGEPNVDGQPIPGRPEQDLFGRLEGRHGIFRASLETHYLGESTLTRSGTKRLKPRQIWNVGVGAELARGWEIALDVRNLTDRQAMDLRGFPLPGRGWAASLRWRTG